MLTLLKRTRNRPLATLLIALTLTTLLATLVACATPSTGNSGGGSGSPTATTQPAATPKPSPSGHIPTITLALCKQLMTVDEANTIMQPSEPATSVELGNPYISNDNGGACNYRASATNVVLVIYFFPWNGPVPIPQSGIQAALAQAVGNNVSVQAATPVSGIGAQAEYVEVSTTEQGVTTAIHIFYVLVGDSSSSYIFDCFTISLLSKTMGNQDQLQQCASQVYSRL